MTGIYDKAVVAAEEAEHSHSIPIHKPFSLSYTYSQLDDNIGTEETPAERRSRMTGIYDKAVVAAEEAEHSHNIPIHKPFSLSYTYAQLNDVDAEETPA